MHILQDELVDGMAISRHHSRVITPLYNEDRRHQTGLSSELGGTATNSPPAHAVPGSCRQGISLSSFNVSTEPSTLNIHARSEERLSYPTANYSCGSWSWKRWFSVTIWTETAPVDLGRQETRKYPSLSSSQDRRQAETRADDGPPTNDHANDAETTLMACRPPAADRTITIRFPQSSNNNGECSICIIELT